VLSSGLEACLAAGDPLAQRWHGLTRRLHLTEPEVAALALLVGVSLSPLLAQAMRDSWAETGRQAVPIGLIALALLDAPIGPATFETPNSATVLLLLGRGALLSSGVLQQVADGHLRSEQDVFVTSHALNWLCGAALDHKWALGTLAETPPVRLRQQLATALRALTSLGSPVRALVTGPPGSGRMAVAGQLARALAPDAGLLLLPLERCARQDALEAGIADARTLAVLTGALVVVTGADALGEQRRAVQDAVVDAFADQPVALVWIVASADSEDVAAMGVAPEHVVRLGAPSKAERAAAWQEALGSRLQRDAIERLAGGFLLSEGQILRAAREAVALSVGEAAEHRTPRATERSDAPRKDGLGMLADSSVRLEEHAMQMARSLASTGLGTLARPEPCRVGLDRLVLEPETRTLLDELVAYAGHRNALASQWGFDGVMSYGLGVTALFTGPPGTGKTLAATAIARELGQELYRIDLSQLVSKYIGETEKHLGAVFDAAEKGGVVLLFDEADSVFGKRTDVKTSVDRYANLEVNYLLQRIERFDGVVVLTTNFEAGIDDAFARRIRFRVGFEAPNADARARLWRALLPLNVPLAADVDLEKLAAQFEFSGGHIKEVVLRAASLAMAAGERVAQRHLERSAQAEYRKLGKLLTVREHNPNTQWETHRGQR